MTDNCTLFCKKLEPKFVQTVAENYFDEDGDRIEQTKAQFTIRTSKASVLINSLAFEEPGDRFASLVLTTSVWAEDGLFSEKSAKADVLERIEATELILGVVIEPGLEADGRIDAFLLDMAQQLDGVVFNGSQIFDPFGNVLVEAS